MTTDTERVYRLDTGLQALMEIKLTPEQEERAEFSKDGLISLYNVGLIDPSQVISSVCTECCHVGDNEITIDVSVTHSLGLYSSDEDRIVGGVSYRCGNGHLIYQGHISEEQLRKVPVDVVRYDETGKIRKPRVEEIEGNLKHCEEMVTSENTGGNLESPPYESVLRVAVNWAKMIDYEIDQGRLDKMEQTWKATYVKGLEDGLRETVEELGGIESHFDITPDEFGVPLYDRFCVPERMELLFEALEHTTIPDNPELRVGIMRILYRREKMNHSDVRRLEREKGELEERIGNVQERIQELESDNRGYTKKLGLTPEQIEEARKELEL